LHIHRIESPEEWAVVAWDHLLSPDDPCAPFSSPAWMRAWFAAFGGGARLHVLVARQGDAIRGVLPLCETRPRFAGIPLRSLELLSNGHSPCADLIAAVGKEAEVKHAFLRHLQDGDPTWDTLVAPEVRSGARLEALHTDFPALQRDVQLQRESPYMRLDGDWEALRGNLSKNFQRVLRNNRNRMSRAGRASIELVEEPDAMAAALADMFAIGERSWQGSEGSAVGSTAANRAFYTGLVHGLGPSGWLRLWFLRLDGRRIAFEFHVAHAGVEFGLKTGYDREFESIGAGTFLDQSIVERLCAEKRWREYDLLGNADFYKRRWTPHARPHRRLLFFGTRGSGRLLSLWNLRLKPVLKQVRDHARPATAPPEGESEPA
jgi:CelD/BcsL family acetyltransferase involved in cellulose biosynthesis